jgi:hypothetical protein
MILLTIIQLFFVVYNVITAKINSDIELNDLKNNKTGGINHDLWGGIFIGLVAAAAGLIQIFFQTHCNYFLLVALLLERKFVFDIFYNIFQQRDIFYAHKNETSIIDNIYNKIFNYNVKLYQFINIVLAMVLQFFIYK